ncbi:hypothetical protein BB558_005923 [Smittium angustum]|uniref:RRM domain-containing protein n=1 Tax=Smittium angustum TaxID=133377 RepID=A0A2U1IZ51_SMIAN|nr:hypothetical protein BB558_005923 [Smittium angustum]
MYNYNASNSNPNTQQGLVYGTNIQPTVDYSQYTPKIVTTAGLDMSGWQWLQDNLGYTFGHDPKSNKYYYYDAATGVIYDYTEYYTAMGYVNGKLESKESSSTTKSKKKTTGTSSTKKKDTKDDQIVRTAGGQIWVDKTLDEWDPDDHRMFIGDLNKELSEDTLKRAFSDYPSVTKVRIVRDNKSGYSKGYGFIAFSDPNDFIKAFREMNGKYVGNRPIKLRKSTWKERNMELKKVKKDPNLFKVFQTAKKHIVPKK